jgi:hypothetical protein
MSATHHLMAPVAYVTMKCGGVTLLHYAVSVAIRSQLQADE